MKKTLMVLTFALCASFAFAQTNKVSAPVSNTRAVAADQRVLVEEANPGYNGSIFTKDDELMYCDFAAEQNAGGNYSTGTVGANQYVGGVIIPQHQQTHPSSMWHRIAGASTSLDESTYPVSFDVDYFNSFNSDTRSQGIMLMSMQDQIAVWGGYGTTGNFDAYIAFPAFSTAEVEQIDVRLYQYYRCFNNDQCWIDYSTDNSTWNAVEFNVRGVDVAGNSAIRGWVRVMLPNSLGNKENVYIRVRWSCSDNTGGAYGYIWILDDVAAIETPLSSFRIENNDYFEGFYQMIPKNLQLPVVWYNRFFNNGQLTHANVVGKIMTYANNEAAQVVVTKTRDSIVSAEKADLIIDPYGWYDSAAVGRGDSWASANGMGYWDAPVGTGAEAFLPTSATGTRFFYSDMTTTLHPEHIGDSVTFDTLRYDVNWNTTLNGENHQYGTWARDNGSVRGSSYFCLSTIQSGSSRVWSTDPDETAWNQAGYSVYVSYVTGADVPEGWKVLGMEMVAATEAGMQEPGAKINASVLVDMRDSLGDPHWGELITGASTYVIQEDDVIDPEELENAYEITGYNTVRIMFPNQPALEAFQSYRVGYELAESAEFAVATNGSYYWIGDSAVFFSETDGMKSYGHNLPVANGYSIMIYDPGDGYLRFPNTSQYPMIRLLVGPGFWVPKVAVNFVCDDETAGYFLSSNEVDLCGQEDSVAVGGSYSCYIMPVTGYEIDTVWINNVPAIAGVDYSPREASDGTIYGVMTLNDVQVATTLRCKFKEHVGIDVVSSKVSMKLQPNPATSNVNVSLKGVSGNVNMSLLDMSGRVVASSQFNAENGTNINVSNLAKGAYFVRITNSNFTKIEKLIVR